MPEREQKIPLYNTYTTETAVSRNCEICGMLGIQRLTVIIYDPTPTGKLANYQRDWEYLYGDISWQGDHSGCLGNMRINL